ncbi:hypothetical protein HELRODRAFT_177869 [Helobdella robusta]|uniref:Uncharacterized protein n=1 Tax=Helobdella robusta TaxID=6412 RepID=T1FCE3_HELRO|nr:hypothetical protein HELRODRAFT_177869 [Helobdella robusta]ESN97804.1 hypothetical protein HELRODRAFT_177869 [Helobdella robusta]
MTAPARINDIYKKQNGVSRFLKNEFKPVNFLFPIKKLELFNRCQWPIPAPIFVIYKGVFALYLLVTVILFLTNRGLNYFVYMTNISFTVLTIYFISSAIRVFFSDIIRSQVEKERTSEEIILHSSMPTADQVRRNLLKFSIWFEWLGRDIAYIMSPIVTTGYFGLVVNLEGSNGLSLIDIHAHILNVVIVVIDMSLSASPLKWYHLVWAMLYGTFYGVFSYIYYSLYGLVIYKGLTEKMELF